MPKIILSNSLYSWDPQGMLSSYIAFYDNHNNEHY